MRHNSEAITLLLYDVFRKSLTECRPNCVTWSTSNFELDFYDRNSAVLSAKFDVTIGVNFDQKWGPNAYTFLPSYGAS